MVGDVSERYRRAGWWTGQRLIDRVESHVVSAPDETALVSGAEAVSRGELWRLAGEAAEQIRRAVGNGRHVVVIVAPNCTAWCVLFLAALRAGQVPATPPATTTVAHLRHIFDLTEPALVVWAAHGRTSPGEAIAEAVAGSAAEIAVATTGSAAVTLLGPARRTVRSTDVPADTAHLMFTSSTTGPPKAVSHSEDSLATLNLQFAERFGLSERTPVFMPSPLGHSVGAIHGARLAAFIGAPLVLQDQWDAVAALDLVARHRADFTAAATPFLVDLADAAWHSDEPKLAPLRSFLCGGAQVPPALIRRCRAEFPHTFVTPLWGMTEGGLTTCTAQSTGEQVEQTVGVGLPGLELRTLDDEGRLHDAGAGELVMRGPGVFNGYYGQARLYSEHIVGDGFFRTGDLAHIDPDGYVSITGRVKDLIIRGAVNISPVETENAIAAHPDVVGVAVIGWPDERLGERLCAVVEANTRLSLDDLVAFCAEQGLSKRHWPERLVHVDHFPRTAGGKIRKQQLRDELVGAAADPAAGPGGARSGTGAGMEPDR